MLLVQIFNIVNAVGLNIHTFPAVLSNLASHDQHICANYK